MNDSQPKKKRQHPPTPLGTLLNRHFISLSKLQDWLGAEGAQFSSRGTIRRIIHGTTSPALRKSVNPALAKCLSRFLNEQGVGKADIDAQLLAIFDEGEYQPMIKQRIELTPDIQTFFGLSKDPFTRAPQSRDEVFIPPQLQQIVDRVIDAIKFQGFVAVIGDIGSGKSTLRALVEDYVLGNPNLRIVWPEFFDMKNVTPMQIAESILSDLGMVKIPGSSVKRGTAVKDALARQHLGGNRISLGFDECHRLNRAALKSLKNFFEMSSGGFQRYLGVLLFGQPLFVEETLAAPEFREIYERIVVIEMPKFSDVGADYLRHRLKLVDMDLDKLFDKDAVELIVSNSETPLSLGNVANEALTISMRDFNNKKVIGSAIKTKMFFENRPQAFRKRA